MKSEIKETPYHGNLMKELRQKSTDGHDFIKTIEASDIVMCEYQGFDQKLETILIRSMEIRKKELDQPLGFFKSVIASIANISKAHHFLIFETDAFLISVDYYIHNRLVIRLGDKQFVYQPKKSQKRAESILLVEGNGLQWKCSFLNSTFTVGKLLDYLLMLKMRDFSQASYNGQHFSKQVYRTFQDEFSRQK